MRALVKFCQWFVGILFIFSGLIKVNDPLGFSYKLDEYFSEAVLGLEFLQPYALVMAIGLVVFEVILGVMLLLGFQKKFTLWSLTLMIVFFTFLTFYSAYFNKVTDCGCFGDAIPLTPWQSFSKDVILTVMILILLSKQEYIYSAFAKAKSSIIILVVAIICFLISYYALMHLPAIDFRAYKVSTNMPEAMADDPSQPDVYGYDWYYNVDGKEEIITTDGLPPQGRPGYVDVKTRLIEKGYEPPIHDFSIELDGEDFTSDILSKEKIIFITIYDMTLAEDEGLYKLNQFIDRAESAGYEVIALSSGSASQAEELMSTYGFSTTFYTTDGTQLKTAVRSNPGVMVVDKGVIKAKSHWNDLEDLDL